MDQGRFQEGQQAYAAGDYRSAAKLFLAAAGKGSAGNGAAYHMAGNALMRLRRHQDAVTVYGHALRDDTYDKRGAVHANLGQAYSAMGEYAKAESACEAALAEPGYATPWKALQGAASALLERGRVDDAAVAYRKAAIEPGNPDPGKALVNLGLCFMALGRPADAAEAYKAALGFDTYQGRGKALANLGIAYTQMGEYEEAVRAFERATQLHAHKLSGVAQQAYDSALAMTRPARETIDGWETGDLAVVGAGDSQDGWATGELAGLADTANGRDESGDHPASSARPAEQVSFGDEASVDSFFGMTEDEMKQRDREARRADRAHRRAAGGWIRTAVVTLVVTLLLAGSVFAGYWFGLGWPTQDHTVEGLLASYQLGEDVSGFWIAVTDKDVDKEMAKIPPQIASFQVDGVKRGSRSSEVSVTVTPEKGAPLHYKVTLAREGVGWKVTGVDNDWRSTSQ